MLSKTLAVLIFAMTVITPDQHMKVMNADEITFIDELMGIAQYQDGSLVITSLNNKGSLLDEYKDIDIQLNDVIIYTNGKPIKSLEDFKEVYGNIAVGEEVKLGIRRGEEMFIVNFKRMDSSKIKRKIITMDVDSDGGDMKKIEVKGEKNSKQGQVHPHHIVPVHEYQPP